MSTNLNYDRQLEKITNADGFVAALDQSGGSTPKALKLYGIPDSYYTKGEESMFDYAHMMRERIITSQKFNGDRILAAILFEDTVRRDINGVPTAKYLWEEKGIVPIIKIDEGLMGEKYGVQVMKQLTNINSILKLAKEHGVFGTKARSVIKRGDEYGIKSLVQQQFAVGMKVLKAGLHPILEPEVDIYSDDKEGAEKILRKELVENLNKLDPDEKVMLKLTPPSVDNYYKDLTTHPNVLRVVALSGGYTREKANTLLSRNEGVVASFSRALTEGLKVDDSAEYFDTKLDDSIGSIFFASTQGKV